MNRRDFLKLSALFISMSPLLVKSLWAKETSIVAVAEGQDYGAITRKAVNALGGMGIS